MMRREPVRITQPAYDASIASGRSDPPAPESVSSHVTQPVFPPSLVPISKTRSAPTCLRSCPTASA